MAHKILVGHDVDFSFLCFFFMTYNGMVTLSALTVYAGRAPVRDDINLLGHIASKGTGSSHY